MTHHPSAFPVKRLGCCTQCGAVLWDAKQPPSARPGVQATVVLADGSWMSLTVCAECFAAPDLDRMWGQVLAGWLQGKTVSLAGKDYVARQARDNFILACLFGLPWDKVGRGLSWQAT